MRRLSILSFVLLLLCSCEGIVENKGKVVSSQSKEPIAGVLVKWKEYDSTYTDEQGLYEIGSVVACVPDCPGFEVILTKEGYKSKVVKLPRLGSGDSTKLTVINMEPYKEVQPDVSNNVWSRALYYYSMLFSIFNIFTLVMVWRMKVKSKWWWTLAVCYGSISLHFNYLNSYFDMELFRFFIQGAELHLEYPSWHIVFVPVGAMAFWIKQTLMKNKINLFPTKNIT